LNTAQRRWCLVSAQLFRSLVYSDSVELFYYLLSKIQVPVSLLLRMITGELPSPNIFFPCMGSQRSGVCSARGNTSKLRPYQSVILALGIYIVG
jgi:hypothetical protein